ncbi:MAG: carboxypeptidase regulatory-like domain-containing protein [Elusimicrobia bacterium]|nr:carboxypeptidase regulatory-like domain-containing protein [Elusimicrobiota bacterium]
MNCPKCQFVLPDDKAAECPFCHAGLKAGASSPESSIPGAPPPMPELPPIPFGASTPAPRPAAAPPPGLSPGGMIPPPMAAPPMMAPPPGPGPMQPPPGIPGLTPPPFPGLMPPTMPQAGAPAAAPPPGLNHDPLNLEGLNRAQPAAAPPVPNFADPLDTLAFTPPAATPASAPAAAPRPSMAPAPMKAGEIEFEAPPPPSKGGGKNFAMFALLAVVGVGYQTGFLSLDAFYNMLSKGTATPAPMEPLPPIGTTQPSTKTPVEWKNQPTAAPTPTPGQDTNVETEVEEVVPESKEKWTFEGRIYDMITLRPVYAAEVRLQSKDGKPQTAQTDERGRYKLEVPALDGGSYQLTVVHPDYDSKKYFDEISPPYKELELMERRALVRLVPRHKTWTGKVNAKTRRDLVLLPAQHHIQSKDDTPSLDSGLDTGSEGQ